MGFVTNALINQTYFLILNATNMKELARIQPKLNQTNGTIPTGFHGHYYADL